MMDKILIEMANQYEQDKDMFCERVVELLNDEWSPDKHENFWSAMMNQEYDKHGPSIAYALKHHDMTELGRIIFKCVEDYCIKNAEDQASYEMSQGEL